MRQQCVEDVDHHPYSRSRATKLSIHPAGCDHMVAADKSSACSHSASSAASWIE